MSLKVWLIKKGLEGKLPLWVYRLTGSRLAKALKLEDVNMADEATTKKWYQSKAVWSAILMTLVGAIQPISTAFGHPYQLPLWVTQILMGLGVYGVRTGDKPIS